MSKGQRPAARQAYSIRLKFETIDEIAKAAEQLNVDPSTLARMIIEISMDKLRAGDSVLDLLKRIRSEPTDPSAQ